MTILELLLTSISLACDAFTVSICKGLQTKNKIKNAIIIAFYFGIFQFIMPIIGYKLGNIFTEKIIYYNPYISMLLLIVIGILIFKEENYEIDNNLNYKELFILSIATSIDALVIGISLSFLKVNIISSSIIIGIVTFIICFIGYYLGNYLSNKISKHANKLAGLILIILGIKIFIQNLLK